MAKRKAQVKIDPELAKQLQAAAADARPVEAVVMLKATRSRNGAADNTRRAKAILERVAQVTGLQPDDVNIFQSLPSFVVSAKAAFIEGLLDQAEVSSVLANKRPPGDILLSPARG